ncbi:MAG TPA: hypothetical protein VFS21_29825 [Roseiflexaceae bacterium]|nr:hypothetical protein [Roseiflexaceae bacterium]
MSAIALTSAQVAPIFPEDAEIFDFVADELVSAGQAIYGTTTGGAGLADADASGKDAFRGIALNSAGAGQAVSVLKKGHVAGFAVSGMAYNAPAYLSTTAGGLDTAAPGSGTTLICGRVVPMSDSARTKVLYIDADWV